jgi:hypothetical protein
MTCQQGCTFGHAGTFVAGPQAYTRLQAHRHTDTHPQEVPVMNGNEMACSTQALAKHRVHVKTHMYYKETKFYVLQPLAWLGLRMPPTRISGAWCNWFAHVHPSGPPRRYCSIPSIVLPEVSWEEDTCDLKGYIDSGCRSINETLLQMRGFYRKTIKTMWHILRTGCPYRPLDKKGHVRLGGVLLRYFPMCYTFHTLKTLKFACTHTAGLWLPAF